MEPKVDGRWMVQMIFLFKWSILGSIFRWPTPPECHHIQSELTGGYDFVMPFVIPNTRRFQKWGAIPKKKVKVFGRVLG